MSIFEVRTTASHRYYMNKRRKLDIIHCIQDMSAYANRQVPSTERLMKMTKYELASEAMKMHRESGL